MNRHNLTYIALAVAIIAIAYLAYDKYKINETYKSVSTKSVFAPNETIDNEVSSFSTSTTYYDFKYVVPKENQIVAKEIKDNAEKWLKETNIKSVISDEQAENDFGIYKGFKYSYESKFETYDSPEYVSYVEQVYTFTGGAHGSSYYNTYIIRKSDNKKISVLSDVYNINIYSFLSDYTRKNLPKELLKKSVNIDDFREVFDQGTSADKDNWNSVFLKKDKLVVIFGQYQIGPYVIGIHELEVSTDILLKYKK